MTIQERQSIKASTIFQERYREMPLAEVMEQYESDYRLFLQALAVIPEDKRGEPMFDTWRVNEIIAHVAHWNIETIQAIRAVRNGEIPWFFDDEEKINEMNKRITEASRDIPFPLLLKKLEKTHKELVDFLRGLPEEVFHSGIGKTWKNQNVTPALVCSYRHYLAHAKDILTWLDGKTP